MWSCECVSGATVSQQSRNMFLPRNICRSFVITLAIVLLLLESPVNGYSIRRSPQQKKLETPVDLIAEESTVLEIKNDKKRPNDIKTFEVKDKFEVSSIVENEKSTTSNANIDNATYSKERNSKETTPISTSSLNGVAETIFDFITTANNTEREIPDITTEMKKTMDTSTEIDKLTHSISDLGSIQTVIPTSEVELTKTNTYNTSLITVKETDIHTAISEIPFHRSPMSLKGVTRIAENGILRKHTDSPELQVTATPLKLHSNYSNFLFGVTNRSADFQLDKKDVSLFKGVLRSKEVPSEIQRDNNTGIPREEVTTVNNIKFSLDPNHRTSKDISTILESTLYPKAISSTAPGDMTDSDVILSFAVNTDSTTGENLMPTELDNSRSNELSWNEYTVIDRKRPATTDGVTGTTDYGTEITRAETSQGRYIFDKSLHLTPLTPSGNIIADKIDLKNQLLHNQVTLSPIQQSTENEFAINASMSPGKISQPRLGMVSSKRAGFLDYSGKTSTSGTTTHEDNKETLPIMYEPIDLGENERLEPKNISAVGPQIQLSEDAITEELLKEEMMNDQIENTKRSHDDRGVNKDIKALDLEANRTVNKPPSQLRKDGVSDDTLSVHPISHEQGKNVDLYVVSPNYKPMKRIEVQPAKPFIRDPDDNSWRNISISSLGIVFKPKNSSKSFTQVLKNKTETELSSFTDRDSKTGLPDLRERLEKIAEVRKSKKKRVNKNGDTVYSDYEENNSSGETATTPKVENTSSEKPTEASSISSTSTTPITSTIIPETTQRIAVEEETTKILTENIFKFEAHATLTTPKPSKKFYNIAEYYDTTDEYDADYLTLSKIDIKKFTIPVTTATETTVTSPTPGLIKPLRLPERKPTVEYFPPRVTPKLYDYDIDFQRKINLYNLKDNTKPALDTFYGVPPTLPTYEAKEEFHKKVKPIQFPLNRQEHINLNKNLYFTETPQVTTLDSGFDINDENFNRGSYVIKHYRDFINAAAKDDDDKNAEYIAVTEPPAPGSTLDELAKLRMNRLKPTFDQDYDYQIQYRKNMLNKFVNNFNHNSEKYKVEFPIVYNNNNSIDHRKYHANGNVVDSPDVLMKQLYENPAPATKPNLPYVKPCHPNCEKLTVELSPAYELHYYVPDQEEKQVAEIRPKTVSYHYRL